MSAVDIADTMAATEDLMERFPDRPMTKEEKRALKRARADRGSF